jgi:hypothetical protein
MRIKKFDKFNHSFDTLIVVDVQRSFSKFYTKNYLNQLKKYCREFKSVYQIWDNHIDGKFVDKDYLYDHDPDIPPNHDDLYTFPNQVDLIEKRYNYDVNVEFYKKILSREVYNEIYQKESDGSLFRGEIFNTTEGTAIVYIGNNHKWFHIPKKLYKLFSELNGDRVIIVGGADSECLEDVYIAGLAMGVDIEKDDGYIYSADYCPL